MQLNLLEVPSRLISSWRDHRQRIATASLSSDCFVIFESLGTTYATGHTPAYCFLHIGLGCGPHTQLHWLMAM